MLQIEIEAKRATRYIRDEEKTSDAQACRVSMTAEKNDEVKAVAVRRDGSKTDVVRGNAWWEARGTEEQPPTHAGDQKASSADLRAKRLTFLR